MIRSFSSPGAQRALLQNLREAILVLAVDGQIDYASDSVTALVGYAPSELLGKIAFELVAAESREPLSAILAQIATQSRATMRAECVLLHLDGSRIVVEIIAQNLLDDPDIGGLLITARPSVSRSPIEDELRRSEARSRALLDAVPDLIFRVHADGTYLDFHARPQARPLVDPKIFLHQNVGRILPPAVAQLNLQAMAEVIATGELRQIEYQLRLDDGVHEYESRILPSGPDEVFAVVRDITASKALERSLRQAREDFRQVLDGAPLGAIIRQNTQFAYVNRVLVAALGYDSAADLFGREILDLIYPSDRAKAASALADVTPHASGRPPVSVRMLCSDGQVTTWELYPGQEVQFEGERSWLTMAVDVTESERLRSRLMLTDRMASMGTLAAGVAHEINNPLAYLTANLRYATDAVKPYLEQLPLDRREELESALADSCEGAERVRLIVRDLKAFSRGDQERHEAVDLHKVLDLALKMAHHEIRHRARLVLDLQPVGPVDGNEARLGQVFLNLIVNAAHSIPPGRATENEIRVTALPDASGAVLVEISDTGAGIAPENLARLFDPFFTTKTIGEGTGLGLAICHGIVAALGGEIAVESTLGKGSTFRVLLPPARPSAAAHIEPRSSVRLGRVGRILVIDDEPLILVALRRLLGGEHTVEIAGSAREALARIESGGSFDVILCDLMMPDITGMELHSRLVATNPPVAARLFFLTGGPSTGEARAFLDRVDNGYMDKPFDGEQLRAAIRARVRLSPG